MRAAFASLGGAVHLPSISHGTAKLWGPVVLLLRRLSGAEWQGIGKMWPEGLRTPPVFDCIFSCIVACRVAQFSPNSTTYREAKLLSPHNRDAGLHIFKTGDWHLAMSMVRSTRTRFRQMFSAACKLSQGPQCGYRGHDGEIVECGSVEKWCSHGQGMRTRNSFWPARRGHSVPKFLRLGRRTGWEKLPGRASFPLPTNGTIGSQYQTPRKRNSH